MTFPIKKRTSAELLIGRRAEIYIQKWEPELSGKIEEGKNVGAYTNMWWEWKLSWLPDWNELLKGGMRNNNDCQFEMTLMLNERENILKGRES